MKRHQIGDFDNERSDAADAFAYTFCFNSWKWYLIAWYALQMNTRKGILPENLMEMIAPCPKKCDKFCRGNFTQRWTCTASLSSGFHSSLPTFLFSNNALEVICVYCMWYWCDTVFGAYKVCPYVMHYESCTIKDKNWHQPIIFMLGSAFLLRFHLKLLVRNTDLYRIKYISTYWYTYYFK